mmetsp:Transcript_31314/g.38760  ORF Transcript_31314/g.38760 Transcript_31314/m.38760 type:complete len:105 (-) Transcript_31314:963-1277(-)
MVILFDLDSLAKKEEEDSDGDDDELQLALNPSNLLEKEMPAKKRITEQLKNSILSGKLSATADFCNQNGKLQHHLAPPQMLSQKSITSSKPMIVSSAGAPPMIS